MVEQAPAPALSERQRRSPPFHRQQSKNRQGSSAKRRKGHHKWEKEEVYPVMAKGGPDLDVGVHVCPKGTGGNEAAETTNSLVEQSIWCFEG